MELSFLLEQFSHINRAEVIHQPANSLIYWREHHTHDIICYLNQFVAKMVLLTKLHMHMSRIQVIG